MKIGIYFSESLPPSTAGQSPDGFTRLELLMVLSVLLLLAMVAAPVLANTKTPADRVACVKNIRLVGRAEPLWASERQDRMRWWVDVNDGGTQRTGLQSLSWFNYGRLTNELSNPTILTCPSDAKARAARDF